MTTIAHISDTHLGNRQYGSDIRRQDFINGFEAAVEVAIDADADAIIHTGDLFHRRTPPLPEVNACIRILQRAADADIPFYAIVGNHDRKMDDQWLDLIAHTGTASRLDQSPIIVGGGADDGNGEGNDNDGTDDPAIALYGIDAVPAPAWDSTSFALDAPSDRHADAYRLLCMHQLLSPPVPEIMADYPSEAVIDRLDIEIDGLALGDYHEAESATVEGVDVWYAGSTERGGAGEAAPRSITLLESTDDGGFRRTHRELDTRPFRTIEIEFGENDGRAHARDVIQNHDLSEAVAVATLIGKRTSLTAGGVHDLLLEHGAAVARVDDNRGREHLDIDLDNAPSAAVEDPDTLIDERLAEAEFSETTLAVEREVRGESTATNSLDSTTEDLISEAQEAAFSEGGPDPAAVLEDDESVESDEEQIDTDAGSDDVAEAEPTSVDGGAVNDDIPEADREVPSEADPESTSPTDEAASEDDGSSDSGGTTDTDEATSSEKPPESGETTESASTVMDSETEGDSNTDGEADTDSMDATSDSMDATSDSMDATSDSMDATSDSKGSDTSSDSTNQASFADLVGDTDDTDDADGADGGSA